MTALSATTASPASARCLSTERHQRYKTQWRFEEGCNGGSSEEDDSRGRGEGPTTAGAQDRLLPRRRNPMLKPTMSKRRCHSTHNLGERVFDPRTRAGAEAAPSTPRRDTSPTPVGGVAREHREPRIPRSGTCTARTTGQATPHLVSATGARPWGGLCSASGEQGRALTGRDPVSVSSHLRRDCARNGAMTVMGGHPTGLPTSAYIRQQFSSPVP